MKKLTPDQKLAARENQYLLCVFIVELERMLEELDEAAGPISMEEIAVFESRALMEELDPRRAALFLPICRPDGHIQMGKTLRFYGG